jgi:hypothetical protein
MHLYFITSSLLRLISSCLPACLSVFPLASIVPAASFAPLLVLTEQPLEFGRGELVDFDFARIESDLRDALRPSAQPFALAHREFLFKGEIKEKSVEATMLAGLSLRITQSSLSDDVINQVKLV